MVFEIPAASTDQLDELGIQNLGPEMTNLSLKELGKTLNRWMLRKSGQGATCVIGREGKTHCVFMSFSNVGKKRYHHIQWKVASTLEETRSIIDSLREYFKKKRRLDSIVTYYTSKDTTISAHRCQKDGCSVYERHLLKKCSMCKQVFYCSREHQKDDWKQHKVTCLVDLNKH